MTALLTQEQKKGSRKFTSTKLKTLMASTATAMAAAGLVLLSASPVRAQVNPATTPTGGNIVDGQGSIAQQGLNTDIFQDSQYLSIEWQSFSHGKNAVTEFHQPNSSAWAFNFVVGNADGVIGTIIDGTITANGNIGVFDQNGVIFGKNARIDTVSFMASTGKFDLEEFKQTGTMEFSDFGDGSIEIQKGAQISVSEAGLAAFVSPFVANNGVINAKLGTVALAAGETVTIDMYGDGLYEIAVDGELADALVENAGTITAEGGKVLMTAQAAKGAVDNIINMSGVADVSSVTVEGGKIVLNGGGKGKVEVTGVADASGGTNGGEIEIKGQTVEVDGAGLFADGGTNGNGGDIMVYGTDKAILNGYVTARGGSAGGNGGTVELSSPVSVEFAELLVDTTAANGEWGSFTIDPAIINIFHAPMIVDPSISAEVAAGNFRDGLLGLLLGFTDLVLAATEEVDVNHDIDISEGHLDFEWNNPIPGGDDIKIHIHQMATGNLTLLAPTIDVNGNIVIGTGNLNFVAETVDLGGTTTSRNTLGGGTSLVTDEARLGGLSNTINVGGTSARIDQAINFMADFGAGKTINVAAGSYDGGLVLDKNGVALVGAPGAVLNNTPGQTGVRAEANNTEVSGFTINGGAIGIQFKDADGAAANGNTFNNQTLAAMNFTGTTTDVAALTGNVFDGAAPSFIRNTAANAEVDASNNIYNGLTNANYNPSSDANPLDLENLFELEDRTLHRADNAAFGLVSYVPGALFVTEGTAGIQNAVNIADAGNSIYVQAGTYIEDVVVDKALGLYGANADINPNTAVRNPETVVAPIGSTGFAITAGGTTIDGFSIVGGTDGVFVADASLVTVTNNIIEGSSGTGVRTLDATGVIVSNNTIDGFDTAGISLRNSGFANVSGNVLINGGSNGIIARDTDNASISGNDISDITDTGIQILDSDTLLVDGNIINDADDNGVSVSGSNGIVVSNNTINVSETGVTVEDSSNISVLSNTLNGNENETAVSVTDSSGVTVSLNEIDDYETGVDVLGGSDVTVSGNIMTSVDYGVIGENVVNLDVLNNIMTGNSITGVWVLNSDLANVDGNTLFNFATGILVEGSDDVTVNDNATTNGETGISVTGSLSADVTNNTVNNAATTGIKFANGSTGGLASGNTVNGNGSTDVGITTSANSTGATIDSNTVYGTTAQGILANNGTSSVSGNVVYNTGSNAIEVNNSAGVTIASNKVGMDALEISQNDVAAFGINVNNSADAQITGNKVDSYRGSIFVQNSDSVDVDSNDVRGFYDAYVGIEINNSDFAGVTGNKVHDGNGNGISLTQSDNAEINENEIDNVGQRGINIVFSDFADIVGNKITNTILNGIEVFFGDDTYVSNNIVSFFQHGIVMIGDRNVVLSNTVHDTNDSGNFYGITSSGDFTDITGNTVYNIAKDGITAEGENLTVSSNLVGTLGGANNIGDEGIDVNNSAGAQITGNTVTQTVSNGISVNPSPNSLISGNNVSAFGTNGIYVLGSDNVDVFGNIVDNDGTGTGIRVENSNGVEVGAGEGIGADSNIISDVEYGVYVQGGDAVEVDNNDIDNAAYGVFANGTSNVLILDNLISNGLAGVTVSGGTNSTVGGSGGTNFIDGYTTGVHTDAVGGFEVSYNTISNTGTTGVDVDAGTGGSVNNNTISGSTTVTGIDVIDHDGITVDANTLTGFDATNGINVGISIDSSLNAEVTNNILTNMDVDGIRVFNESHGTNVELNTVNDTAQVAGSEAIYVDNSDSVTVLNNTVKRSFVGIGAFNSDNLTVDSNIGSIIRTGIKLDNVHTALVNLNDMIVTAAAPTETVGIAAVNSSNLTITNNILEDFMTAGIRIIDSETALVDNNTVRDTDFGIRANNVSGLTVTNNDLDGRVAPGAGTAGIFVGFSEGAIIGTDGNGNTVTDFNTGIRVQDSADSLIEDNNVTKFSVAGIRTINSGNTTININTIDNDGGAGVGIIAETSNGTQITANDIDEIAGNGIQLVDSHDSLISGNLLDNIGGNGIWVDPSDNAEVAFNVMNNVTLDGILVDLGLNAYIHDNVITGTGGDGIDVNDNDGARIIDNNISATTGNGVDVADSFGANVFSNTISGITGNGINVTASDEANIEENDLDNVTGNGVKLTDSHDVTILANTMDFITGNGIWIDPSNNVEVADNILRDITLDGILVDGGKNAYIHDNRTVRTGDDGIDVNGNSGARIEDNRVFRASGNGIEVDDSFGAKVLRNVIGFITGNGVKIDGSDETEIDGNRIFRAGDDGIDVDGSDDVLITNNRIRGITDDGIDVTDSYGATINTNDIAFTGDNGIRVEDSDYLTAESNIINQAGNDGIHVENGEWIRVGLNTIGMSGNNGIDVDGSDDVKIYENIVTESGNDGIQASNVYGEGFSGWALRILGNTVDTTGDDGIDVTDGGRTLIEGNIVSNAGEGNEVEIAVDGDDYGADGITVRNAGYGDEETPVEAAGLYYGDEGDSDDGYSVIVRLNIVDHTGDDGIEVAYSGRTLIEANTVTNAGAGEDENYDGADGYGADGIHVRQVTHDGIGVGVSGDGEYYNYAVNIIGNTVDVTADDGIEVIDSGSTVIASNIISDAGYGDEGDYEGADEYGADGIHVRNVFSGSGSVGATYAGIPGEGGIEEFSVVIKNNTVDRTGDDGAEVADSGRTLAETNTITTAGAGENEGGDLFGADGIHVRNVFSNEIDYREGTDGEGNFYNYAVNIIGNTVSNSADDGIEVVDSGATVISGNNVSASGGGGDVLGADGIHARGVSGSEEFAPAGFVIDDEFQEYAVVIEGNTVNGSDDDGVEVLLSGDTRIANNIIGNSGTGGFNLFGGDGIFVLGLGGFDIDFPPLTITPDNTHIEIVGNTVTNSEDDGVEIWGANVEALADGNTIDESGDNGINLLNLDGFFGSGPGQGNEVVSVELIGFGPGSTFNSTVTGNTISDSGSNGLFVEGSGHDDVIVSGNVFTNNPVHAHFESGDIDLTGEGNVFNFGETALRFAPFQFGESEFFADMSLEGNTIGSQFFNGQSELFVELANGAFFNPGTPTVLDATDSTFVTPFGTVRPSDTNDLIGADVFAFLETRFFHFQDLSTLGLFFFGNILSPEIDQKDIFRQFGAFGPFTGNVQFTLNGLPFVDPAFALAALSPAAGGQSAEELAGIEPAAGGSGGEGRQQGQSGNEDVNCWADAAGAAGAGGSVTYGFGSGLDEVLADAAGCSSEGL